MVTSRPRDTRLRFTRSVSSARALCSYPLVNLFRVFFPGPGRRVSSRRPTSRAVASENARGNARLPFALAAANPPNYSIIRQHTGDASSTYRKDRLRADAPLYSKYDRKSASQRQHQRLVDISLAYSPHRKPDRDEHIVPRSEIFLRPAPSPLHTICPSFPASSSRSLTRCNHYVISYLILAE